MSKRCFVIMPFGKEGSELHHHFQSIFEKVYRRVATDCGYGRVDRGDSQLESGDILQKVIQQIAGCDLLIADLTGANPNVYYELGVRHSLAASGTILTFDEAKTSEMFSASGIQARLPFNVQAYRVLNYTSSGTAIFDFESQLRGAIQSREHQSGTDSPVHNAVPSLPPVLSATPDQVQTGLRDKIDSLQRHIEQYRQRFGDLGAVDSTIQADPIDIIEAAFDEAKAGNRPRSVVPDAERAVQEGDMVEFLATVKRLRLMTLMPPTSGDFIQIYTYSQALGLGSVGLAILRIGRQRHPQDAELESFEINEVIKSSDREERLAAKDALLAELSSGQLDSVSLARKMTNSRFLVRLNAVLDAFYRNEEPEEALEITERLLEAGLTDPAALRNHARAIEQAEGFDAGLFWHRASVVLTQDAPDSNAVWLGNHLHNEGHRGYSAEAFALASRLDPDDAKNLANLADEVGFFLRNASRGLTDSRVLPPEVASVDFVKSALWCSFGVKGMFAVGRDVRNFQDRAAQNIEADLESLLAEQQRLGVPNDRAARAELANKTYKALKSALTTTIEPIPGLTTVTVEEMMSSKLRELMPAELTPKKGAA